MSAETPASPFEHVHGAALLEALQARFTTATDTLRIGHGLRARDIILTKPANADHLISEADYVMDERLPYWADLWPSARVLADVLAGEPGTGRTLLEMGCGLGLDTMAAMHAGFAVTATDYYDEARHMARYNASVNLGREPATRMVNWRQWPDDLGTFDVVIAADVLYEKEYATLVGQCLARALSPNGEAILADPGRLALPAFREQLPATGLHIASTERIPFEEGPVKQEVQIMRIRWR